MEEQKITIECKIKILYAYQSFIFKTNLKFEEEEEELQCEMCDLRLDNSYVLIIKRLVEEGLLPYYHRLLCCSCWNEIKGKEEIEELFKNLEESK